MVFSKEEIVAKINTLLIKSGIERRQLDENRLTSIQIVELLISLEKEFQFEIDPTEYEPKVFSSYESLVLFVEKTIT